MNPTRATAAQITAKAVQSVAQTAAKSTDHKPEAQPATITATVLHVSRAGVEPLTVEIGARVFTPARDQVAERRAARLDEIGRELEALSGPTGSALLSEYDQLWTARVSDVRDYVLRQAGYALLDNHLVDLWRLLYAQLGDEDDRYRSGAADEFLHGEHADPDRGSRW